MTYHLLLNDKLYINKTCLLTSNEDFQQGILGQS